MLRIARVLKTIPEAHAVDIQYLDGGGKVPSVQVMSGASNNSGYVDLPAVEPPDPDYPLRRTRGRDVYVVVGTVGGIPVVLGFLTPEVSQVLFKDRVNFRIDRHPSDVYSSLDDDGNLSMVWPNGTALTVGEHTAPEDLTGKDFDAKWKLERNTGRSTHVRLVVKAAGDQKALIHITPDGDATIQLDGDLNLAVTGNINSSAVDWNHTGDLHVTGDADATGTITATTDVIGGGKSLKNHVHAGVTAGGASTEPPT